MTSKNRTCKICKKYKDISNFQPKGYQCKECRAEKQRNYWAALPYEIKKSRQAKSESQKKYAEKNPEKIKFMSRKSELKRKFNITIEDYENMLKVQNNVCAICENKCSTGNNLAVDHDHKSGQVRGLLCKNCNTSIGLLKENSDTLKKAINYLEIHKILQSLDKELLS
jgi:hypothetical protein